jgi:hypothetical protein
MLERLRLEFGVDVAPAEGLTGAALDTWVDAADEALFLRLHKEMREQKNEFEQWNAEQAAKWQKAQESKYL